MVSIDDFVFNHYPDTKIDFFMDPPGADKIGKEDEKESKVEIGIITADCAHATTAPCYLELVTPVEELEPYFLEESHDGATIVLTVRCVPNGEGIAFRYCPGWGGNVFHSEEQFRQHAEAERDRLNAEWREEQSND